ncbi:uncharacterized protein LOC131429599 [Malaya genurostris]|uniref:uncharacterized protein LOC131429599 n=1 Tax=Malaya genurostris TaxID=325434 RepID=UPI0026F39B26|nr:uncharacterized protein LOC131429599 [Malaya genurostris]
MQSENKVRRFTRSNPIDGNSEDTCSNDIHISEAQTNANLRSPKHQSTMASRIATPRKTPNSTRKTRSRPISCSSNSTTDDSSRDETEEDEDDDPNPLQPKLTRLKAKQLNKKPLPIVPLNAPRPDAEVAALIREELGSDDDDEEYKPTEDDIHSDDDPNTTISDIDSQPRTPATPATSEKLQQDIEGGFSYTKDGLFKIPRPRNDSQCSHSENEQENIARRTRSKLCLQTTAIETIESTFIPPDITTDMYDFDCDMDHVWKEFLSEFTKPLPINVEDDDDTDPEYIAAGRIPIDREELREVKVSRKELNELVSELLECGLNDDETFLETSIFNTTPITNEGTSEYVSKAPQTVLPVCGNETECQPLNIQSSSSATSTISEVPVIISTPSSTATQPLVKSNNTLLGCVTSLAQPMVHMSKMHNLPNTAGGLIAYTAQPNLLNHTSNIQHGRSLTNFNSGRFFVQLSTIDPSSYQAYYLSSSTAPTVPMEHRESVEPSDRRYRFNHTLMPVEVNLDGQQTGFVNFQLQLLQQQLRVHVQLAAQNFLQSYAHPKFWKMANTFKNMLIELQNEAATNPAMKAWNLDAAVDCCLSWESELQHLTDENNEFMEFLLKEAEKAEKAKQDSKYYQSTFHPKMMEKVVNNRAFLYPKLLPYTPFRMDLRSEFQIIKSEERLIAFGMELFFPIVTDKMAGRNFFQTKKPTLQLVCQHVSKYLCTIHSVSQIYSRIACRRRARYLNPIKQFFTHLKAPPFQHILEMIDFDNVIPPGMYQQGELPHLWDRYIYSNSRFNRINSKPTELITDTNAPINNKLSTTTDANVNITISLVVDSLDDSYNSREDIIPSNPDYLNRIVKPTNKAFNSTRYVSEFNEEFHYSARSTPLSNVKNTLTPTLLGEKPQIVRKNCCKCRCHSEDEEISAARSNCSKKTQKRLTDYYQFTRKNVSCTLNRKVKLKEKLWEIYQRYRNSNNRQLFKKSYALERVIKHFQLIEEFSYYLNNLKSMSSTSGEKKQDGELTRNEHSLTNGTSRRVPKIDNVENKDANYAYNFFEKVEETLLAENKHSQYETFLEILQTFNEREDRVADLYYKIENLLVADHPELVDLFLTFLLPGQAAEVGKFLEHFILTNANDFLAKLNIYFAKQPSQIKKVYSCINDLSNESDVTMEQIKSRILPLLKGNPLLIDWFLQLFPPEKPPESNLSDYEVVSLKKLPPSDFADPNQIYEDVPFVEVPAESVCGTKYIQGRIVYGTLPARLSFLSHDYVVPASPQNESSPIKGCVHNLRHVEKTKNATDGEEKEQDELVEGSREDPRYKLCDDATFKAHAIRLNPLVHGGKGTNYAEVAHLLVSDGEQAIENDALSEEEKPVSPKKCAAVKLLPKKRINSPVNKKPCIGKSSSPTANKRSPTTSVPADSKVVAISKKLKGIMEAPNAESNLESLQLSTTVAIKRKPNSAAATPTPVPVKRERLTKKSSSETLHIEEAEGHNQPSWTRDEDKIILEEIKNGFSTVDELVKRIEGKIENRQLSEIERRYEFLMEVLKKFQKGN